MTITLRKTDVLAMAILIVTMAVVLWPGELPSVLPVNPSGPYLVTAIKESGDTNIEQNLLLASLRMRDENGWEHDFQEFDPDDMDAKYDTHPAPSLHVEPIAGGKVIYSGPLPGSVAGVDEVIDSL